jgi:hypothetical protein
VMGFASHQQMHGEPPGRIVGCSHFSRQHHGGRSAPRRASTAPGVAASHTPEIAPKWASGSTWFGWVFTESAGLSSCALVAISPCCAKLGGGAPRGMRSAGTPPPTPAAGTSPAGPCGYMRQ